MSDADRPVADPPASLADLLPDVCLEPVQAQEYGRPVGPATVQEATLDAAAEAMRLYPEFARMVRQRDEPLRFVSPLRQDPRECVPVLTSGGQVALLYVYAPPVREQGSGQLQAGTPQLQLWVPGLGSTRALPGEVRPLTGMDTYLTAGQWDRVVSREAAIQAPSLMLLTLKLMLFLTGLMITAPALWRPASVKTLMQSGLAVVLAVMAVMQVLTFLVLALSVPVRRRLARRVTHARAPLLAGEAGSVQIQGMLTELRLEAPVDGQGLLLSSTGPGQSMSGDPVLLVPGAGVAFPRQRTARALPLPLADALSAADQGEAQLRSFAQADRAPPPQLRQEALASSAALRREARRVRLLWDQHPDLQGEAFGAQLAQSMEPVRQQAEQLLRQVTEFRIAVLLPVPVRGSEGAGPDLEDRSF